MIRILGAVLVACGASWCGIRTALSVRSALAALNELQTVLETMESEIRFRRLPLPELFRSCAGSCRTQLAGVFARAAEHMEQDAACSAEYAVLTAGRPETLPKDAFSVLCILARSLGRSDLDGQLNAISLARARLGRLIEELSRGQAARCRSYCALGVCAGLAIAILLI